MSRPPEDPAVESIDIAASPEKVWDLLTRVEGIPTWYDGWDTVHASTPQEQLEVGLTFQLVKKGPLGRRKQSMCQVTELIPGSRISWVESAIGRDPVMVRFDLINAGVNRTTVRFTKATVVAAPAGSTAGVAAPRLRP